MKNFIAIFAAATALQSVQAGPVNYGEICEDVNFKGTCTVFQADGNNVCVSFTGSNAFWNDKVSSLSIFGGHACDFYINAGCTGPSDHFNAGPYNTVPNNDAYSSFLCGN